MSTGRLLLMKMVGTPRNEEIFNVMKLARSKFKYAIIKCKRDNEMNIANNVADK